ncbi:hypothetical protein [Xanthomonas arboricola]|uniref:hypothetical protein n=1 Tax=Xanthomonas arboricola TaxID=56448 RepID=UPI001616F5A1|nr:hypothetical protein [Xanthomonas arboricola]MBB5676233.1 hypothetical protein [Xanthomonas arboricola]
MKRKNSVFVDGGYLGADWSKQMPVCNATFRCRQVLNDLIPYALVPVGRGTE